jgi:hypothetical protein
MTWLILVIRLLGLIRMYQAVLKNLMTWPNLALPMSCPL